MIKVSFLKIGTKNKEQDKDKTEIKILKIKSKVLRRRQPISYA